MAIVPWYNSKTGETYIASNGGYTPPSSDWVRGNMDRDGKVTPRNQPGTPPPSVAPPVEVVAPPYVPYIPPTGGTPPPYAPYMPRPIYPPNTPPYYSYPPDTLPPPETVPPYIPPGYATRPPVADPRDSRGGGRQTAPEGRPGEGFNPSPGFARTMLDAGKAMSNYPVMAPFGMAAKVAGSLANKYGSYLSTVAERNAAAKNVAAGAPSGSLQAQSSRVLSQLRSNEGYGDGPTAPGPAATPQQAAAADADRQPVGETSRESGGGGGGGRGESNANPGQPGRGGGGAHLAHGGIAALHQRVSKMGRSPKKPK